MKILNHSLKFTHPLILITLVVLTLPCIIKSEDTGKKFKKWGYVHSNSFEKFPQSYINRMEREYDILCITGLLLRGTGQLRFENELINKISKAGIGKNGEKPRIIPMIGLSSIKDGITLLGSESSKNKSIDNINKFLISYRFKTVHIDFEGLPEDYAKSYAEYLKTLKIQLTHSGIELSIAIYPPLDFPDPNSGFHDPQLLSNNVDSIVLMAYDLHNTKTDSGCVTSETWSEKNLQEILKFFPPEKVWLGVPSYGYEWSNILKTPRVISSREANLLKKQNSFSRDSTGCIKIISKDGNRESVIFYADEELRNNLEKLSQKYNLIGTAMWRIGLED